MSIELIPGRIPLEPGLARESHAAYVDYLMRLHQALANPTRVTRLPSAIPRGDYSEGHASIHVWETLVYMLLYLMGWMDAGKGLVWFEENGYNDLGDARLRLLRDVWNAHGHLPHFTAWSLSNHYGWKACTATIRLHLYRMTGDIHPESNRMWDSSSEEEEWARRWKDRFSSQYPDGREFLGGNLHLGRHLSDIGLGSDPERMSTFITSDPSTRKAVLLLDQLPGWYGCLAERGGELPNLGARSWHVDVVVRSVGWLGTFRRSRVTGLWFQGKHSVHMRGNPS